MTTHLVAEAPFTFNYFGAFIYALGHAIEWSLVHLNNAYVAVAPITPGSSSRRR